MMYVHLDNPYNSTIFTNCCNVAINDNEFNCPACKAEVFPGREATEHQRSMNRWNYAYGKQKQQRQYGRS